MGHMQAAHSETLLWKCGRSGLPEHLEAGRGGSHAPLPCRYISYRSLRPFSYCGSRAHRQPLVADRHCLFAGSDLSHYKGKTTTHRFEKTYRFRSHDLPSSTHRIGFLFSAPQLGAPLERSVVMRSRVNLTGSPSNQLLIGRRFGAGDTFYLHHLCWRPLPSDEEIKKGGHAEWECSVQ